LERRQRGRTLHLESGAVNEQAQLRARRLAVPVSITFPLYHPDRQLPARAGQRRLGALLSCIDFIASTLESPVMFQ